MVAPALKQPFMDGAYWSIVNEITFYGWVFVLIALGLFRRGIVAIVIVWIALSMVNEALLHSGLLRRLFVTDQSGFFCAGLVLYEIFRGRRDRTVMLLVALAALTAIDQAFIGAAWDRAHYQTEFDNLVDCRHHSGIDRSGRPRHAGAAPAHSGRRDRRHRRADLSDCICCISTSVTCCSTHSPAAAPRRS